MNNARALFAAALDCHSKEANKDTPPNERNKTDAEKFNLYNGLMMMAASLEEIDARLAAIENILKPK